jgi:hypothetical protein
MSVQSRHSARTVPTHRSQKALAFGARIGVKDASFVGDVNLLVACWGHEDTPVCLDADADGRLGGEG